MKLWKKECGSRSCSNKSNAKTNERHFHNRQARGYNFARCGADDSQGFNVAKAGHLGTLDPLATGVLPVSVGKATRLAQFLPSAPKEYTGEIQFGFSTNTYDREGSPTSDERSFDRSVDDIRKIMRSL